MREAWLPTGWGAEEGGPAPPRSAGRGAAPAVCPAGGTHTRSPVLIPWLLRSWTMSWVRPGQSPALSTPMFPGARRPLLVPWASAGPPPDAPRHPFPERGRAAQRGRVSRAEGPPARAAPPLPASRLRSRRAAPPAGRAGRMRALPRPAGGGETSPSPLRSSEPPQRPADPHRLLHPQALCTLGHPHSPLPPSQTRTQTYLCTSVLNARPESSTRPCAQGTYLLVRARQRGGMKSTR